MELSGLYIWIFLGGLFICLEVVTVSFGFMFVGLAAFAGAAASALNLPLLWQLVIFVGTLILTFAFLRPRFIKKLSSHTKMPGRAEMLVGQTGHVADAIDPSEGTGRVIINGEDWAAESKQTIKKNTPIKVIGYDGIKLKVEPQ